MIKTNEMSEAKANLKRMLGEERQGFVPGELVGLRGVNSWSAKDILTLIAEVALSNTASENSTIAAYSVGGSFTQLTYLSEIFKPFGRQLVITGANEVQEINPTSIEKHTSVFDHPPAIIVIHGVPEKSYSLADWARSLREYAVQKGCVCFICYTVDRSISNELDLELTFSTDVTDDGMLVSVERGKHRKPVLTPTDDLYFEFTIKES